VEERVEQTQVSPSFPRDWSAIRHCGASSRSVTGNFLDAVRTTREGLANRSIALLAQ